MTDEAQWLTMSVNARSGDIITLEYQYDSPDISPMYYSLGPVQLETLGQEQVQEQEIVSLSLVSEV
jgi:hypothetical protein